MAQVLIIQPFRQRLVETDVVQPYHGNFALSNHPFHLLTGNYISPSVAVTTKKPSTFGGDTLQPVVLGPATSGMPNDLGHRQAGAYHLFGTEYPW
jgi:hypothetical protein